MNKRTMHGFRWQKPSLVILKVRYLSISVTRNQHCFSRIVEWFVLSAPVWLLIGKDKQTVAGTNCHLFNCVDFKFLVFLAIGPNNDVLI